MANKVYAATALIGGAAGALDAIDGAALVDKDMAFVIDSGIFRAYILDVDSALVESSPSTIMPDTNAGDKRWILQSTGGVYVSDASYDAAWDGVTGIAPSKNAIYDILVPTVLAAGGGTTQVPTANFTAVPASTSTITMLADMTASILPGQPIKYVIGGVTYYGMVTAMTAGLMTIAGPPLGGNITSLYYLGNHKIMQVDIVVNGFYEDATNVALIASDLGSFFKWQTSKAYLVKYSVYSRIHDTGTHGKATVIIAGADVNTVAGGVTIAADATWYPTVVDINSANYDVNYGETIEISVTKSGNGDAQDLTVSMIFVLP